MTTGETIIIIILAIFSVATIFLFIFGLASEINELKDCTKKMSKAIEILAFNNYKKSDKPLKPETKEEDSIQTINICPICGEHIYSHQKCCPNCGQRLDWN